MRFFWASNLVACLGSCLTAIDKWLKPIRILGAVFGIVAAFGLVAVLITVVNIEAYWHDYDFCLRVSCLEEFPVAFKVQLGLLGMGGKIAAFVALVLGPYAALKGYLSTAQAEAFGNHIAHFTFFERFVENELRKRDRIAPGTVDIFSLYRVLFPSADGRAMHASVEFIERVEKVCDVMRASSRTFVDRDARFDFGRHRAAISGALRELHITQYSTPRIDFLEAEDQLIDFLCMLSRIFGEKGAEVKTPQRSYR